MTLVQFNNSDNVSQCNLQKNLAEVFDLLKVGDVVLTTEGESGIVVDKMKEPLIRIKVDFDGGKYPRPLWISLRLLSFNF